MDIFRRGFYSTSISFRVAEVLMCGLNGGSSTRPISYIHVAYAVTQSAINSGCFSSIRLRSYQLNHLYRISTVTRKGVWFLELHKNPVVHNNASSDSRCLLHGSIVPSGRLLLVSRPHWILHRFVPSVGLWRKADNGTSAFSPREDR